MPKSLNDLQWVEDLLPQDCIRKHMFGGFAYYIEEKIVLALFESEGDRSYKDQKFDFDIWNGCMFPSEKIYHSEILRKFPFLMNHPVLPKWLYLPVQSENFEDHAATIIKEIRKKSPLFGAIPKAKKKTTIAARSSGKKVVVKKERVNLRVPQMFRDEPAAEQLSSAKKISDLKNLGPAAEFEFQKAGIRSAQQFIKMGWKKAIKKLSTVNEKNRHSLFAYALIGALTNKEWSRISDQEKLEAREFVRTLKKTPKAATSKGKSKRKSK